jgi:hypothetical protein
MPTGAASLGSKISVWQFQQDDLQPEAVQRTSQPSMHFPSLVKIGPVQPTGTTTETPFESNVQALLGNPTTTLLIQQSWSRQFVMCDRALHHERVRAQ